MYKTSYKRVFLGPRGLFSGNFSAEKNFSENFLRRAQKIFRKIFSAHARKKIFCARARRKFFPRVRGKKFSPRASAGGKFFPPGRARGKIFSRACSGKNFSARTRAEIFLRARAQKNFSARVRAEKKKFSARVRAENFFPSVLGKKFFLRALFKIFLAEQSSAKNILKRARRKNFLVRWFAPSGFFLDNWLHCVTPLGLTAV